MNLILFDEVFQTVRIEASDERSLHIRQVLRPAIGAKLFVGFVNGPRGRAEVTELSPDGSVCLELIETEPAPECLSLSLLVGLPRPHTAKRILSEAAAMGVARIDFFQAERGEPAYAQSRLWQNDLWKERLRIGVQQSFGTCLPDVNVYPDLQTAFEQSFSIPTRVALDNYEAVENLGRSLSLQRAPGVLAFGAERGWSPREREALRRNGWKIAHLGPRVLRVETAVTAALAVAVNQWGLWREPTTTAL